MSSLACCEVAQGCTLCHPVQTRRLVQSVVSFCALLVLVTMSIDVLCFALLYCACLRSLQAAAPSLDLGLSLPWCDLVMRCAHLGHLSLFRHHSRRSLAPHRHC